MNLLADILDDAEMGVEFSYHEEKLWFRPRGWTLFWTKVPENLLPCAIGKHFPTKPPSKSV